MTAACNDWHHEPADFHLGTGHQDPTHDAGYTTASDSPDPPELSITPYLREESIYALFGDDALPHLANPITNYAANPLHLKLRKRAGMHDDISGHFEIVESRSDPCLVGQ